jgi:IS5 family transposase
MKSPPALTASSGIVAGFDYGYVDEEAKRKNTTKARVRAKVEHPFRILKRVFGFTRVRYRGIWKNHQWLCAAFALVNLYQHRNRLAPQRA